MAAKKALSRAGSSRSGAASPNCPYTCAKQDPPRRFCPAPRSSRIRSVSPWSVRSWGVRVRRTSPTGAKADTISDRGAVISRRAPSGPFQTVFMLMESLPTGMAIPRAGHSSMPTARTVS